MSSLKKRNKRWYIKFYKSEEGKEQERTLSLGTNWKSIADDKQKKLDKLYDQHRINPFDPHFKLEKALNPENKDREPKTVEEAKNIWLKTKKRLSSETYKTYEHRIKKFIEITQCKHDLVKYIVREKVETYLFREGIGSVTANSDARHLNVFLNYLVKNKWLDHNPIPDIDIPEGNVEYYKKMLRDHEFTLLLETFESWKKNYEKSAKNRKFQQQEWFKPMLATFYYGGFRLHEIGYSNKLDYSGLQLKNFVDNGEMIWIPPTKGRKERFIPISKHLKPLLDEYIALRKPVNHEDYIFIHFEGSYAGKPVTGRAFREAFNDYCKKAKIPDTRTPHGLRHQRITSWIQDGFGVKEASLMAGHSSSAVTEGVYTHLAFNSLKEKLKRIEGEG